MNILHAALLGLVQGLCEFLPVSSSAHMLLVRLLMGIQTDSPAMKMLDILLHVGTLIPILALFWKDWIQMLAHPIKNRTLLLLFVASLPTLVFYFGAKKLFPGLDGFSMFDSGWFMGVCFLITAALLLICDIRAEAPSCRKKTVNLPSALVMGIFQGLSPIPGISRSGSTITGGVLTGLKKETAAKFSFMMSVPAVLGSLLMEGKDALENDYLRQMELVPSLVGVVVACAVGFLALRMMLKIIVKYPLRIFSVYLAILGIVYLVLQLTGHPLVPAFGIPAVPAAVPVG